LGDDPTEDDAEESHLLNRPSADMLEAKQNYSRAITNATSRISSRGIAMGYFASIVLLILTLIPVNKLHGSTFSLRLAIGMSGIWWAVFSLPAVAWLPPVTTDSVDETNVLEKWTISGQISAAWKRLGGMLRWSEILKLQHTFRFLAAWFLLSDGKTFNYYPSSY
jgi:UMF1 family MFS transporter